jgi:hypothetical protein
MRNNKARPLRYAQPLLSRNRRGRPFKLIGIPYLQFLSAIREVHAKNRKCATDLSIARKLRQRPEYKHQSERQLRRDVGDVISELVAIFKKFPPGSWRERFGIDPPPAVTDKLLRTKVFEWLLRDRPELMAIKTN